MWNLVPPTDRGGPSIVNCGVTGLDVIRDTNMEHALQVQCSFYLWDCRDLYRISVDRGILREVEVVGTIVR